MAGVTDFYSYRPNVPADVEAGATKAIDALGKHPAVKDYLRRQYAADGAAAAPRNTEPWHAIGEKFLASLFCMASMTNQKDAPRWLTDVGALPMSPGVIAAQISGSATYLWTCEMRDIATQAPLPPHVISRDVLPMPRMFWSWETAYGAMEGDEHLWVDWVAVLERLDRTGVQVITSLTNQDSHHLDFIFSELDYGMRWPQDFPKDDAAKGSAEILLKLCAFLNSPFTESEAEPLSRPRRRELQRADKPEEAVAIVRLRKRYAESTSSGESDRDWQHQWWVSGHYRAQWYPSQEAHKVIWISPYLKGPRDKPLLEKVYTVVR